MASDSVSSDTTTIAVDADLAALTAALMSGDSADGVPHSSCDDWPLMDSVYCWPAVRLTATE